MEADEIVIRVLEHIVDFENLRIRPVYKKLGKSIYTRISDRINSNRIVKLDTNDPGITTRTVEEKTNG